MISNPMMWAILDRTGSKVCHEYISNHVEAMYVWVLFDNHPGLEDVGGFTERDN